MGKGRDMGFDSINSFESKVGLLSLSSLWADSRVAMEGRQGGVDGVMRSSSARSGSNFRVSRTSAPQPPPCRALPPPHPMPGVGRQRRAGHLP